MDYFYNFLHMDIKILQKLKKFYILLIQGENKMSDQNFCFFCLEEIKEGKKVNWITKNGIITVCSVCDKVFDKKSMLEELEIEV